MSESLDLSVLDEISEEALSPRWKRILNAFRRLKEEEVKE